MMRVVVRKCFGLLRGYVESIASKQKTAEFVYGD
jgi:hypothetical protein